MRIFGVDFTSSPSPRKPITCAVAELQRHGPPVLTVEAVRIIEDFSGFEALLREDGPWVAGFDFPFGLPRRLVEALGWPRGWSAMMETLAGLGRPAFEARLREYTHGRQVGDKEHYRPCDRLAAAASAMKLVNPPTAKMFFEGATRLHACRHLAIPPHRPGPGGRTALETYPALVARRFVGRTPYKGIETPAKRKARRAILRGVTGEAPMTDGRSLTSLFGFTVSLPAALGRRIIADPGGDELDAVLCAVEAAWGAGRAQEGYGIPPWCDADEGWIVDPGMPHAPV